MSHGFAAVPTGGEPQLGHYKLLNTIGLGSFAKVRLARHILPGTEAAVKAVNQQGSFGLFQEVHCMKP